MPKKNRYRSPFIRTPRPENSSSQNPDSPPASLSYKLYRRISDCPLDIFIDCHCDGRLEALVIEGEVPAEILQDSWGKMWDDFLDKMQDEDGTYLKDQVKS